MFSRKLLNYLCALAFLPIFFGCDPKPHEIDALTSQNVRVILVDWHIAGFWVINSPVAWIRVVNYNYVPITNILIRYETFDDTGKRLNDKTYLIDEVVKPKESKNFIEQYLGLVDVSSQRLKISLISVEKVKKSDK